MAVPSIARKTLKAGVFVSTEPSPIDRPENLLAGYDPAAEPALLNYLVPFSAVSQSGAEVP